MKRTNKRLLSILLCLAMVMAMLPLAISAEGETVTMYFDAADKGWTNVNVYYWGGSSSVGWPGNAMTNVEGTIWSYEVPADAVNIIFNNGSAQTSDLVIPTDGKNIHNGMSWGTYGSDDFEEVEMITLYADAAVLGYSNIKAYYWGGTSGTSWPGEAMTLVDGTIYSITISADTPNIIFNGDEGQTSDLSVPTDGANMWDGSAWVTYGESGDDTPANYELVDGVTQTITIPAGGSANVVVDATASAMTLKVNGNRMYYDWTVQAGMMPVGPNPGGFAEVELPAGSVYTIAINNASADAEQVLDVTASAPVFGTMDNPAELVIGTNSVDIQAGSWGYFYTWTATEDGELTVAVDTAVSSDWTFVCNVYGVSNTSYGDTHYSDDVPVDSSESLSVSAGDEVEIVVGTASNNAATVVLDVSFVAGSHGGENPDDGETEGGGETDGDASVIDSGSVNLTSGTNEQSYTYEWTAPANGKVNVNMSSESNPGWAFVMHYPDGSSTSLNSGNADMTYEYDVVAGETYIFEFWSYSRVTWGFENGTVVYEVTFVQAEGDQEVTKEEYVVSDIILGLGENHLTLDPGAITTIYEFCPEESGIYTFTADDSSALVGYWGAGSFFVSDYTADKTSSLEFTLENVGPSIMVGVSGVENVVLTIEKTDEFVPEVEPDWEIYENIFEIEGVEITDDQTLVPIDVTDDIADELYFDEDGNIRYGSETGPLVVTNLQDCAVNFVDAYGYGQLKVVYRDEDGTVLYKIDFNEAFMEYYYSNDGINVLNLEIMSMLYEIGSDKGWYDPDVLGFYLWEDAEGNITAEVDPETAWMFACAYIEGTEIDEDDEDPIVPGDDDEDPIVPGDDEDEDEGNVVVPGDDEDEDDGDDIVPGDDEDDDTVPGDDEDDDTNVPSEDDDDTSVPGDDKNPQTGDVNLAAVAVAMLAATAGAVTVIGKKKF